MRTSNNKGNSMTLTRTFAPILAALVAALTLSAPVAAETTLERVQRTGEIRIGYANETPFAYTKLDGTVTGESPEIAKIIFSKIGVTKVNAVLTEWGSLIPGLIAGRFDVIAAGMYVTPERAKQVLFSDPHYQLGDTLLVAKGNPRKLTSYADIAANDKVKIAIMAGTSQYAYAIAAGIPEGRIMQVPSPTAQLMAVRTRRAQAAVGTALTMKGLAVKGGRRVEATTNFQDDPAHMGYGALAFRQQDADLRDTVNTALQGWIGSEEHLRTVAPFGFDASNLTKKTLADIVQP
jgi:polar amino acid transport system substrate-binding protein